MSARWITADVFDGLATLDDGSVDLVVTSPPFLALRSYLPADHPDKGKEIGSESTPAEFLDVLLRVTAELRRVLAPHGSIAVELGDTYAGSGGAGGDYDPEGLRAGQPKFRQNNLYKGTNPDKGFHGSAEMGAMTGIPINAGPGWPLAKSVCMIPEAYRFALAYGFNPFTGQPSPAGQWRVRNKVTWARPNPPVGALGDKWRPATSDVVVACLSDRRYWDDLATRKDTNNSHATSRASLNRSAPGYHTGDDDSSSEPISDTSKGAPLLDWWEFPPGGYPGSHYAVFPPALVEPCVKAMGPQKVCRTCGEPSRRIVDLTYEQRGSDGDKTGVRRNLAEPDGRTNGTGMTSKPAMHRLSETIGWTDCGHGGDWRPGLVLDPFAGSGTTLMVATGHGLDAVGIDLDSRNAVLAEQRVGGFFFERVGVIE